MLPLPPPKPPPPLYTLARVVMPRPGGGGLDTETEIADARRDGSAVGVTFGRMVNSVQVATVYILKGKWRKEGGAAPRWNPVALLPGRPPRVAVARFAGSFPARSKGTFPLYAATFGPDLTVGKSPLTRRPTPAPRLAFGPEGPARPFPRAWATPRLRPGNHPDPLTVRYARLPNGDALGTALLDTANDDRFDLNPEALALLKRGGEECPLRDFVRGRPDLGAVLWASPEGWLLATLDRDEGDERRRGLAWLEPVREEKQ